MFQRNNSLISDVWRFGVLVSFAEFALRIGLLVQVTPEARVLIEGCPKENFAGGAAKVCCSLQGRLNISEGKGVNLNSSSLRAQSCLNDFSLTATPKDFVGRSWKPAGSQAAKARGDSGSTFWPRKRQLEVTKKLEFQPILPENHHHPHSFSQETIDKSTRLSPYFHLGGSQSPEFSRLLFGLSFSSASRSA